MNLGFSRKFKIQWFLAAVCIFPLFISYAASAGSIVGWGSQVVEADLSGGFTAISAGGYHSLGLKQDGSIVAWGENYEGQCDVPLPDSGFTAVAAGGNTAWALRLMAHSSLGDGTTTANAISLGPTTALSTSPQDMTTIWASRLMAR